MTATDPRTALEHLIRQRGCTYDELVAEFEGLAEHRGERATITSRHLRRLAAGERASVLPSTGRVLEAMFGHPPKVLLRRWDDETAALIYSPEVTTPPSHEELLAITTSRARQFTLANAQSVSDATLEQIHDDIHHLAVAYPQQALPVVLGDLAEMQDTIFQLLELRHRPNQTRDLYLLAGVVEGLLAKASHDLGDPYGGLTHARTAFLCGEQADHDGLRAWIKGLQSMIAFWAQRPNESLRSAQAGVVYADRSGSSTSTWLPVNEARAWAALGNERQARAAISRAEAARERTHPDELDELGGLCTFGRARQLYYAADALSLLPEAAEDAERYSLEAMQAYEDTSSPEWSFSDQAGSQADLAIARLDRGEVEGATEALAPVLELPPDQRINGIIKSAQRVHAALARNGLSDHKSVLQLQIESFTRTPVASLPR